MSRVSEYEQDIMEILRGSDLMQVSAKKVRKTLESNHSTTFNDIKKEMNEFIGKCFDRVAKEKRDAIRSREDGSNSNDSPTPNQQASTDGAADDEAFAQSLQELYDAERSTRNKGSATKKRGSRKRATESNDTDQPKRRRAAPNNAFNEPQLLSETLQDILQKTESSRPQAVSGIWDYIKRNNLQDQQDKRYIHCDDKLKRVFETDKIHMFTMNKHLFRKTEVTSSSQIEQGSLPEATEKKDDIVRESSSEDER